MAGYDTASTIQSVYQAGRHEFGVAPNFWMRYFTPSPYADTLNSDAVNECRAAWSSGGPRIGCIMEPVQSRLASNSAAEGQADAQSFCAAVYSTFTTVHPLQLPTRGMLMCWLGQETGSRLSAGYWNGWARTVESYRFAETGTRPLYAGLYCNPQAPAPNCTTVQVAGAVKCDAVWASEPEPCTKSVSKPPAWRAQHCTYIPTRLWQYAEKAACGLSANVDLDVGAPGFNNANYCFHLSSSP
ncbi:MAG TPA: hypothetical protein VH478_23080 [Trebonia sp.]|jgi:hypothetical protein|nr:hypothetical protein [Trebonia sp.]